jgi:hypothetical protein
MKYVTLRHPKLPAKQTITYPEDAVEVLEQSGWKVVDKNAEAPDAPLTPAEPAETTHKEK